MSHTRNGYGFSSNGGRGVIRSHPIPTSEESPILTSAQQDIANPTRLRVNRNNDLSQQQPFIRSNTGVVRYMLFQKVDHPKYSEFSIIIIPDMVVIEFIARTIKLRRHGKIRAVNSNNNMPLGIITSNIHLQPLLLVLLLEQMRISNF